VETEFGLSRPKPQGQGLLLLSQAADHGLTRLGPDEFLFELLKVFSPISFPPIAAYAASLQ
jgi:hypothetical protein